MARAKELDEIASRAQTGSPIGTGKAAFDSSLREEDDEIGSASTCKKWHGPLYRGREFKSRLV